jgi:hypothetical protein
MLLAVALQHVMHVQYALQQYYTYIPLYTHIPLLPLVVYRCMYVCMQYLVQMYHGMV